MNEKNVVLLGESHFAFKNGVTQGILDTGFKCFNLSLGGTPSLQNLYELIRNKKLLENADLIITGSNTHDIAQYNSIDLFPKSYQVMNWLYKCRRKNKISIWKNKTSIKVEILFFYKP